MSRRLKVRYLAFAFLLLAILTSTMWMPMSASAISTPWLTVSGRYINDPSGNHVVLRGLSMVDVWVSSFHTPNTAIKLTNDVTNSANGWYARVIRYPVYPGPIDGSAGWIANPDTYFNNHLDPAIQNCVARQIYCIIDWHYIADYNTSAIDTATRNFWNYVAPRYANTPNVIFELYNEPIYPDNWATWKTTAQPWVNIIRSHAPNNLILIGGPRWSQNLSSAASSPFVGNNLAYVAHIYAEHPQSSWDSWFGNASNSVPFFITEWGWQAGGAVPTNGTKTGFGVPFMAYLNNKDISWTAWAYDPWWQPIMLDTSWNLLGGENYMGQFVKDELALRQNDDLPGGGGGGPTPTRTNTPFAPVNTLTPTRTNTPSGPVPTFTRTSTPGAPAATFTRTPTSASVSGTCSPITATITAPFTYDGAGTFCWQSSNLGTYINSWNVGTLAINGVNIANIYTAAGSYPAKINGYWYVAYASGISYAHFEAK